MHTFVILCLPSTWSKAEGDWFSKRTVDTEGQVLHACPLLKCVGWLTEAGKYNCRKDWITYEIESVSSLRALWTPPLMACLLIYFKCSAHLWCTCRESFDGTNYCLISCVCYFTNRMSIECAMLHQPILCDSHSPSVTVMLVMYGSTTLIAEELMSWIVPFVSLSHTWVSLPSPSSRHSSDDVAPFSKNRVAVWTSVAGPPIRTASTTHAVETDDGPIVSIVSYHASDIRELLCIFVVFVIKFVASPNEVSTYLSHTCCNMSSSIAEIIYKPQSTAIYRV